MLNIWNELPEEVVGADTVTMFDGHLDRKCIEGHRLNANKMDAQRRGITVGHGRGWPMGSTSVP